MSDGTSLSGSTVGESPTKFDPLEVEKMEVVGLGNVSASTTCLNLNNSMSMDEVMASANNIHLTFWGRTVHHVQSQHQIWDDDNNNNMWESSLL